MSIEFKKTYALENYKNSEKFMRNRLNAMLQGKAKELCWFLEHDHVYTIGSSGSDTDIINKSSSIPVLYTARGGKTTYHGPGQRVIYIMLDLNKRGQDLRKYVFCLEEWLINSLKYFNIEAVRKANYHGVWTKNKYNELVKIASIGIRVSRWISYYGVAINVNPCLTNYINIISCGIIGNKVSSLFELNYEVSMTKLDKVLKKIFIELFANQNI